MEQTNHLGVDELRDIVQDAHLNFLLGAGASAGLFKPLGDIEDWLTYLAQNTAAPDASVARVRASVYAYFFKGVIDPNTSVINEAPEAGQILDTYCGFLLALNTLLVRRRSSILDKQVNLFTTNVDLATEVAAEELQIELNDGFSGRYLPLFSASNFGTVKSRRSLHYDNLAEVPTFNLFKLHGSTSWTTRQIDLGAETKEVITFNPSTATFDSIRASLRSASGVIYDVVKETEIDKLLHTADEPTPAEKPSWTRSWPSTKNLLS